jgi:RNA polymerase sigma-70 factor (ECF subfamily)
MADRRPTSKSSSSPSGGAVVPFYQADAVDDATLVSAAREGIAPAQRALFQRYAPRVERLLFRLLGPNADVADALSESFRRAFDRLSTLEDPAAIRVWLFGIAAHVAREQARSARRRSWLSFLPWSDLPEPAVEASPADDTREAAARVFVLVDRLPVDSRVIFSLRHLEGFELQEIVSALGVSQSTVQRRLRTAEQRFFAMCEGDAILRDYVRRDDDTLLFSGMRSPS